MASDMNVEKDILFLWEKGTAEENQAVMDGLADASRDDMIEAFSHLVDDFPEECADALLELMGRGDEIPHG